ncbi:hypothetical protein AB0K21_21540 [Streptosporangium sp. NPDC049248]|uniref:hypothetical protein n=1 Tax=Streptosporangium sp. NPDC049248 TaxID=3155651 RepID=UPI00342A2115
MSDLRTRSAADPDWLPTQIRQLVVVFEHRGLEPTVTKDAQSITVRAAKDTMVLSVRCHGKNFSKASADLTDGEEKIDVRDLMDAIEKLIGSRPGVSGPPAVSGESTAARSNAVQARRASVIRV